MTAIPRLKNIKTIAKKAGIPAAALSVYGDYIAKVTPTPVNYSHPSRLVLVTAMTPTKAGEGKTTMSIALTDGLNALLRKEGKKAVCALRQPSMGPVFGMKGGATGGGLAAVEPSEDININFTGDIHALTAANALISAVIDNSLYRGNPYGFDPARIVFPRAVDMNDRALRETVVGIDRKHPQGRRETFVITAASELMAVFCLARDEADFIARTGRIIVGFDKAGKPLTVKDLKLTHAVYRIMRQALKPNLVQTVYGSPAFVHGGPFANIAHGCCSYRALKAALDYGDYAVTEAGFGAELGAEKFLDILCPRFGLAPSAIVMVASIRSLKLQGGVAYGDLAKEDPAAALEGLPNLNRHLHNMQSYGVPVVCCLNAFPTDGKKETAAVVKALADEHITVALCDSFTRGQTGGLALARAVAAACERPAAFKPLVTPGLPLVQAVATIATRIYGAAKVEYSPAAAQDLAAIAALKLTDLSVCIAKTPLSFTEDPKVQGAPTGFTLHIDRVNLAAGAGFAVPVSGKTLLMPGLPAVPTAVSMEEQPL